MTTQALGARDVRVNAAISRVEPQDDGSLLVEGIVSSEAVDSYDTIIDHVDCARSLDEWRGNIREQHDPTRAVGRKLELQHDGDAKTSLLRAFVSAGAKDTQAKVLDGTLGYFSIGGRKKSEKLERIDGDRKIKRIFMDRISEVSLVDSGSNPDSAISVLRATGLEDEQDVERINRPHIVEEDSKFKVVDDDGKVYGTHDDEDDAKKQLAALYVAKKEEERMDTEEKRYDGGEIEDAAMALQAMTYIRQLINAESSESHTEPPEQLAALNAALDALKTFIASEIKEKEADEAEPVEMADMTPPIEPDPPPIDVPVPMPVPEPEPKPGPIPVEDVQLVDNETQELITRVDSLTADLDVVRAERDTLGKEAEALRKQASDLEAEVKRFKARPVEPGTPVYKGADGKPTSTPPGAFPGIAATSSPEDVRRLAEGIANETGANPDVVQRALAGHFAIEAIRASMKGIKQ